MLNDKLMLLERVFLLPQGMPDRLNVRNAIFSPSKQNSYGKLMKIVKMTHFKVALKRKWRSQKV